MTCLGFKGTDPAMRCRDTQFQMGTKHQHEGQLVMCHSGFHFCRQLEDVDHYYRFKTSRVFIVQHGAHVLSKEDKCVTDEIVFLHEITAATVHELMGAPEYKTLMSENTGGAVMMFAAKCDLETVQLLLDHGADVHAHNDYALRLATACGHAALVTVLLEHGADVHALNDDALRVASTNGFANIVLVLLKYGADVHAYNDDALVSASEHGHLVTVELLLAHGADVNGSNGNALRLASARGHTAVVAFLLAHGANVNLCGQHGSALALASRNGHLDTVAVLLDHGAKWMQ
jgi:hypothetical protein